MQRKRRRLRKDFDDGYSTDASLGVLRSRPFVEEIIAEIRPRGRVSCFACSIFAVKTIGCDAATVRVD